MIVENPEIISPSNKAPLVIVVPIPTEDAVTPINVVSGAYFNSSPVSKKWSLIVKTPVDVLSEDALFGFKVFHKLVYLYELNQNLIHPYQIHLLIHRMNW